MFKPLQDSSLPDRSAAAAAALTVRMQGQGTHSDAHPGPLLNDITGRSRMGVTWPRQRRPPIPSGTCELFCLQLWLRNRSGGIRGREERPQTPRVFAKIIPGPSELSTDLCGYPDLHGDAPCPWLYSGLVFSVD